MKTYPLLIGLGVAVAAVALAQATYSVSVNGKAQSVKTLEKNGEVYLEARSLGKALGLSVNVDAKKRSVSFNPATGSGNTVQGTQQLAGSEGLLGKTYTIQQGTADARNITLTRAEYVAGHFIVGGEDLIAKDRKYVVLYATAQNPQKSGEISASKFSFSGVDSNNKTVGMAEGWYDLKTREATFAGLKPGQKLEMFTYITLENAASLPKLILTNGDAVIRYDLNGKIAPLVAPLASPSNPSVALERLQGQTGTYYPGYMMDLRVDGIGLSAQAAGGVDVPDGGRLLIVNFSLKALGPKPISLGGYNVTARLRDADNAESDPQATLLASRDAEFSVQLDPGQGGAGRFIFALQPGQRASSLRLQFGDSGGSRPVVFDLANLGQ